MEKEMHEDSMTTVTIKPDYAPSEVYSSEPPPAYPKSQSSSVQVAKIVAGTLIVMSVILGCFLLASAYITANASCRQLEEELEFLSEAADRFQSPLAPPLRPEALIQENPTKSSEEPIQHKMLNTIEDNDSKSEDSESSSSDSSDSSSDSDESDDEKTISFKLPLELDFDDLAGALIAKNQKSRMNCVVEKKRAEQVVDHQPKTINLPFGLNLTTDPRYEHLTGEKMAIFCESGNIEKDSPPEEDREETVMIQPVMIPIPQSHFPTHMAQQMKPVMQMQHIHPMETLRPPTPPAPKDDEQFPPIQLLRQIAQDIIAQGAMEAQQKSASSQEQIPPQFTSRQPMQEIPIPVEILSQLSRLPNHNIIVSVSRPSMNDVPQDLSEVKMNPEFQGMPQEIRQFPGEMISMPEADLKKNEENAAKEHVEANNMQAQQESGQADNRQAYGRLLPINIPLHLMQEPQMKIQNPQSEESRPHYVQPRSVRSVDALLPKSQKRVKRCACDCAC